MSNIILNENWHNHVTCQDISSNSSNFMYPVFTCLHCNFHSIICKLVDIRICTVMNLNYVNDWSNIYSKQKNFVTSCPPPLTIKKENGSPQKGKATEVHTNFAYKEIVSCHFQCKQTCRTKYNLYPTWGPLLFHTAVKSFRVLQCIEMSKNNFSKTRQENKSI